MSRLLLAAIIGIPLAWHLALTAFTYYDAGRVGLEPRMKWTAITFLVPLFGFFIYLFERSELFYDPDEDPYRGDEEDESGTVFEIHPSRADDTRLASQTDEDDRTRGETDDDADEELHDWEE
ncbi:PLD nuclease N-terminal domain-containing protein [Natronolimnobius baerhuensis]|uniref:Cardiolipin synthase N-terminal domain-containing protein n=1 Tax=Natronolimnobius baerhuensis TaxID=253108 RepID=A0A202E6A8_9EURY|nr:PLD nuclease N-terminal domain-containing protein [Natronolimnobius baerhuensis]OVE83816.1 hypothetical protein B2G88_15460 [Natronolimnobius baerhuensis]